MKQKLYKCLMLLIALPTLYGCYGIRPSRGGAEAKTSERKINPMDISLPTGYSIEAVASDLTFPTGIAFDGNGLMYVVGSGYAYGETWTQPRLLKIESSAKASVVATGSENGPWNGVAFYEGQFYVSEGGERDGGKILRISKEGEVTTLIENLPSMGDHHTNGPIVMNGYVYFGQGTVTNSGIVGEDNAKFGWLKRHPDFHDIPCSDIVLNGKNYKTDNPLTDDPDDKANTGAYVPFNTTTHEGQIIKGSLPCSGSLMKIPLEGGEPELVAWGFRNPYGMAAQNDKLFVVENGFDDRGSRPVWGTGDILWEVKENQWYGWPDYSGHEPLDHHGYKVPGKGTAELLLKDHPSEPPKPVAVLGVHSSSNGLDFSTSEVFGFNGKAFIAQLGDMAPNVGKVLGPVGFKVVMVDVELGIVKDFALNKGNKNGPASQLKKGGLERPIAVKFHPDGKSLYVVDFGIIDTSGKGTVSRKGTGVVWKITKQ
ncbi:glucose dehydrogenase [uncultured Algoriphagus sp.]|uniref:PQQ-dependent sugar dehydrogenase n=1 Tax=uncultured Algoriphagus sp. TaxID=417365 RepID=UPI0030EC607D